MYSTSYSWHKSNNKPIQKQEQTNIFHTRGELKIKIKFDAKTIEITKTFANKASHFGSEEYHALRTAMCDLPDFEVAIKVTAKPRRTYMKGLSYEFMESFIALNDEDGSIMQDFQCLRQGCSYAEIKRWFFANFPEVNNFAA